MTDTHIKIKPVTPKVQYTGNGSTTSFPYGFAIFDESDMEVYVGDTLIETGYTVTGAGETEGGNVVFDTAPADGVKITLLRNVPIERITDFQEGGTFRPKNINDELDRQTAFAQQVQEKLDRSLVLPPTSDVEPSVVLDEVQRIYQSIDNIDDIADDLTKINAVADDLTKIDSVADDLTKIDAVADDLTRIDAVADDLTKVDAVADDLTNVDKVATNMTNVNKVANNETNINTAATHIQDIIDAPTYAANAEASANRAEKLFYVKPDSSNCVTTIPLNINMTLSSGTLTLKSGSVITAVNGARYVTQADKTVSTSTDGKYIVLPDTDGTLMLALITDCSSGTTDDLEEVPNHVWFDTTNKVINVYGNDGTTVASTKCLPVCSVTASGGAISSIDRVFNGYGFIGKHIFNLPDVGYLVPQGFNEDGTLKSTNVVSDTIHFVEIPNASTTRYAFGKSDGNFVTLQRGYEDVQSLDDIETPQTNKMYYVAPENLAYTYSSGVFSKYEGTPLVKVVSETISTVLYVTDIVPKNITGFSLDYVTDISKMYDAIENRVDKLFTNSLVKVPQNIKLELSSGTLTLKAGSIVTYPDGTTRTIGSDKTFTSSSNGKAILFVTSSGNGFMREGRMTCCVGSTDSISNEYHTWLDTTNSIIKKYDDQNQLLGSGYSLPIAVITVERNAINKIDTVFNGCGFMGNGVFVLPGVQFLSPQGIADDGSFASTSVTTSGINYYKATSESKNRAVMMNTSGGLTDFANGYREVDSKPNNPVHYSCYYFNKDNIINSYKPDTGWERYDGCHLCDIKVENYQGRRYVSEIKQAEPHAITDTNIENALGYTPAVRASGSVYMPSSTTTDYTDNNAVLDYLLTADGTEAGLTITTYSSDYIEITGDYIVLHNVYAPTDVTYAGIVLYDASKNFVRALTKTSLKNNDVGDAIIQSSIDGKYVRFCTNLATKPTYSVVDVEDNTAVSIADMGGIFPYSNMSMEGTYTYTTVTGAQAGLIGYPDGDDKTSTSRNVSPYIEIPKEGILLKEVFIPNGEVYAGFALYDASKNNVQAYNKANLGYETASNKKIDIFIPYSSSYKYVRYTHVDTTSDMIYGVPTISWYAMPTTVGTKGDVLTYDQNGATKWLPAGVVGNKKGLSIGVFGGSFAVESNAKQAFQTWVEKLGVSYTTYAVGGTGFVRGEQNFVYQATNAGVHDIYVIWCSTNDYSNNIPIGDKDDVYGTDTTCWANFKEVVRQCYLKNPYAKVCLFTSSPHLTQTQGNEEGRGEVSTHTNTLREHAEAQKEMCDYYSLPCLDQYSDSMMNGFNYSIVCKPNDFHLTAYGYSLLANDQVGFLSRI